MTASSSTSSNPCASPVYCLSASERSRHLAAGFGGWAARVAFGAARSLGSTRLRPVNVEAARHTHRDGSHFVNEAFSGGELAEFRNDPQRQSVEL